MRNAYCSKWDNGIHDGDGYVFKQNGFYVFTPDKIHYYHIEKTDFIYS